MSETVIQVEGLGKQYRIGAAKKRYHTLRESLIEALQAPWRRLSSVVRGQASAVAPETIWALKDVSFEVKQGEVVGVIGRNGAGKSTLLKILSRITRPTEGRAIIDGRVGSLLEVGTGFHPELTGRQNVYLNGTILGMRRAEIERKFDEIVAFAEIEKFIDTPVKHYSSGMYVRLAFAVAAHLEPEILLVDEVLAVGDVAFQKKCLGRMGEVAREGRTVLFVSHNMQAVQSLCSTAFQLEAGQIVAAGSSQSVVNQYLSVTSQMSSRALWPVQSAPGNSEVKLTAVSVYSESGGDCGVYSSSQDIYVGIDFVASTAHSALCVGFDLVTGDGTVVARSYQTDLSPEDWPVPRAGENRWHCVIPAGLLNAGTYCVCPRIGMHNMYWIVNLDPVVRFEVVLDHGVSPFWNSLNARNRPGIISPILEWSANGAIKVVSASQADHHTTLEYSEGQHD
jgi:lipopolysaccharide transport system ATP-binding protein